MEVLDSEFPQMQLLAAFRIFDVSARARKADFESSDRASSAREAASRLCQAFDVDPDQFWDEFQDHRPIALHHAVSHDEATSFQAWQSAVRKTSARASTQARHPSDHLRLLLMRLGSFDGCTTSGVEQHFSRMRKIIAPDRSSLSEDSQNYELKWFFDNDRLGPASVNKAAAAVWMQWFGRPRAGSTSRLDTGVKRPRSAEP